MVLERRIGRRCGHPERGKDVVQGPVGSREELMVDGEGISTGVVEHASRLPGPAGVGRPAEHRRSPEWEQRRRDLQTLPGGVGQTRFDRVGGNGLLVGLAQRAGLLVEQNRPAPVPAAVERTRDRHGALTAGAVRVGVVERQGCNIEHPTIGRKGRPRIGGALIGPARGQGQPRHQPGPPVLAGILGDRDANCPRPRRTTGPAARPRPPYGRSEDSSPDTARPGSLERPCPAGWPPDQS